MVQLTLEVPSEFVDLAGSEDAARNLLMAGGIQELVRRGLVSASTAEGWLNECHIDWMRLAETGGALDFWNDPAEDIYSPQDGEPL